jgi:GAF domain-containing protein
MPERTETQQTAAGSTHEASAAITDLLASLAAIGRSMQEEFDPRSFLVEFSARIQRLIPHDRLAIACLDDDRRTFAVFAEHAPHGPVLPLEHDTATFDPEARHVVAEMALRPVFDGEAMRIDDVKTDPRLATLGPVERQLEAAGYRSGVVVPLYTGGQVIGFMSGGSLTPHTYTDAHLATTQQVADLIAPFIQNMVLLQRERRRRRRLRALEDLTRVLGASLDVKDIFHRLAETVRAALDFEVMGICLLSSSGRDLEMLAEVDMMPAKESTPSRIPLEAFSFSAKVEGGEPVLIHDAQAELDPRLPGDRMIIDGGGRSSLSVPLWFGERVGGALYFGNRRPNCFDASDVEIAGGIAGQLVLALQHQRLAEEQRRLAVVEGRARKLEQRLESLRTELGERYGFDQIIGHSASLREASTAPPRWPPPRPPP